MMRPNQVDRFRSAANHPTPPPVRDAVRALVQMTTQRLLLLRARQEARFLQRVQDSLVLASTARKEPRSSQQLLEAQANTWMELFRADGITLWINGSVCSAGKTPEVDHLERERKALASANQRLEQLAHFDPLTQVWNRYRIEQAIDAELVAAQRYGAQFGVLLFDVDHFKAINDTYGHALGDDVLVTLAHQVEASLRGCDHLGRWGGEEFVVLARHADCTALAGLAERLRVLITTLHVEGLDTPLTVSVGVAAWQPEDSCKTLVARADQAMYRAKHAGRNRVEVAEGGQA